jgi:hypothetical protein
VRAENQEVAEEVAKVLESAEEVPQMGMNIYMVVRAENQEVAEEVEKVLENAGAAPK